MNDADDEIDDNDFMNIVCLCFIFLFARGKVFLHKKNTYYFYCYVFYNLFKDNTMIYIRTKPGFAKLRQ